MTCRSGSRRLTESTALSSYCLLLSPSTDVGHQLILAKRKGLALREGGCAYEVRSALYLRMLYSVFRTVGGCIAKSSPDIYSQLSISRTAGSVVFGTGPC